MEAESGLGYKTSQTDRIKALIGACLSDVLSANSDPVWEQSSMLPADVLS
jgi:hypothetical protein